MSDEDFIFVEGPKNWRLGPPWWRWRGWVFLGNSNVCPNHGGWETCKKP